MRQIVEVMKTLSLNMLNGRGHGRGVPSIEGHYCGSRRRYPQRPPHTRYVCIELGHYSVPNPPKLVFVYEIR